MAFVADGQSEASLSACLSQLPFPSTTIRRGGIARAIQYLGGERSPESLIVDISGVEMPASQIHDARRGLRARGHGDRDRRPQRYRPLSRSGAAGVSEYIVKPVTPQLLAKALISERLPRTKAARSAESSERSSPSSAPAAASARRRSAVNLAWYLANRQSRRVAARRPRPAERRLRAGAQHQADPGIARGARQPAAHRQRLARSDDGGYGERLFVLSAEEPLRDECNSPPKRSTRSSARCARSSTTSSSMCRGFPRPPYRRALDMADFRIIVADQTLRSVRDTVRLRAALDAGRCRAPQYSRRQPRAARAVAGR